MKIEYEIIPNKEIDERAEKLFAEMLEKQGKVKGDLTKKAMRCKFICLVRIDGNVIAVGGIKQKTPSDFSDKKSGLKSLEDKFEWELGYLYTEREQRQKGIASNISRLLVGAFGGENLMASTEITANPGMVKILEDLGFRLFGNPWVSPIHGNHLGLFLKFK